MIKRLAQEILHIIFFVELMGIVLLALFALYPENYLFAVSGSFEFYQLVFLTRKMFVQSTLFFYFLYALGCDMTFWRYVAFFFFCMFLSMMVLPFETEIAQITQGMPFALYCHFIRKQLFTAILTAVIKYAGLGYFSYIID